MDIVGWVALSVVVLTGVVVLGVLLGGGLRGLLARTTYRRRPHLIPALVTALMLLVGTANSPYSPGTMGYIYPSTHPGDSDGYFMLLRWVVLVASLYIVYKGYRWKKIWVSWLFGFIAILFNPLVQITFSRGTWQVFDVLCALAFLTAGCLIKQPDVPRN